ncbi:MAG: hypothetical protein A3A97_01070 [Candidatus Terrybacteria bacterium RIFCSPLOWO2_01_FULL_40_23]|uniref:Response regulatory domain-containing protein n=1 Tax=Candidatus Terrybacteria bacterium RIFCSPLOWO2_01_FULL_40_23 TaxID=1802366 RepID=A0A1G2PWL8_9BACT|nr:MAG: hypothetical protein A3A97_01070 [Candidatus Terrybacteria bacterium RIFCSPLOWO2_01_FULL_40_23]
MEPQKPILIVEDEKSLMEAVRIKLTHDGFTTSCAGSAEEAEEIMKTTQPSLIWLDLMLPGMQGLDFLRKVRTTEEGAKIPVVVVSNSGSPDKIRESKELGVETYFVKADWRLEEIIDVVRTILSSSGQVQAQ